MNMASRQLEGFSGRGWGGEARGQELLLLLRFGSGLGVQQHWCCWEGGGRRLGILGKCAIIYGSGRLRGTINFHFWESHSTLLEFRS